MAWIESHQTLGRHPKLNKLSRLLGVTRAQAVGHLHYFWWWVADYAPDGDLSRFDDFDIADAAEWNSQPSLDPQENTIDEAAFVEAMVKSGFIDSNRKVHDWRDYGERLASMRESNRNRVREHRERVRAEKRDSNITVTPSNITGNISSNADVTPVTPLHNLTQPNSTQPNQTEVQTERYVEQPEPQVEKPSKFNRKKTRELAAVILTHLCEKTGRSYQPTEKNLDAIAIRLEEVNLDTEGVKQMIDRQCAKWKGTDMEEYLRIDTLFRLTKFTEYYSAKDLPVEPARRGQQPNHEAGF